MKMCEFRKLKPTFTLAEVKGMFPLPRRDKKASNTKKLDCFAHARNDVKNYIVKALSPLSNHPILAFPVRGRKSAFTLAEVKGMSPRPIGERVRERGKKAAFTLAEVMIVVAIIGVVAALVMPSFIQNMSERINSHRQANIAQKITKSVELMVANGDYQEISNTEEFVNKLSKYLKISKICDSEHLTDCWPTKRIKTTLGEYYNVEDAKTAADLHVGKDNNTPNVGLVLADGASLIMTFNPKASPITFESGFTSSSKELPIGDKKTQSFAYTSNATDAIDFVMDVNGKTGPNQERDNFKNEYYDIRSFKTATFGECGGRRIPDVGCVVNLGTSYTCISEAPYTDNNNCWAGAKKACADIDMNLASLSDLTTIYNAKGTISGIPTSGEYWSSADANIYFAWNKNFGNGNEYVNYTKNNQYGALCVGN